MARCLYLELSAPSGPIRGQHGSESANKMPGWAIHWPQSTLGYPGARAETETGNIWMIIYWTPRVKRAGSYQTTTFERRAKRALKSLLPFFPLYIPLTCAFIFANKTTTFERFSLSQYPLLVHSFLPIKPPLLIDFFSLSTLLTVAFFFANKTTSFERFSLSLYTTYWCIHFCQKNTLFKSRVFS